MILLLYRTNLQLSENKFSFLLTLAHRFLLFFYLCYSITRIFKKSTSFLKQRRRRDSNPRAREGKTISSRSRYDHFDTSPNVPFFKHTYLFVPFFEIFVNAFVKKISAIKFSCIRPVLNRSSKSTRISNKDINVSFVKCVS